MAHKWADWLKNHTILGVPNASKRGTKSVVVHKWAQLLPVWVVHQHVKLK